MLVVSGTSVPPNRSGGRSKPAHLRVAVMAWDLFGSKVTFHVRPHSCSQSTDTCSDCAATSGVCWEVTKLYKVVSSA